MDFSKLLGSCVAFFAVASVVFGHLAFRESVPRTTWLGLAVVLVGSGIMEWSGRG
jgi:small multidrug resistance family-3 protein